LTKACCFVNIDYNQGRLLVDQNMLKLASSLYDGQMSLCHTIHFVVLLFYATGCCRINQITRGDLKMINFIFLYVCHSHTRTELSYLYDTLDFFCRSLRS